MIFLEAATKTSFSITGVGVISIILLMIMRFSLYASEDVMRTVIEVIVNLGNLIFLWMGIVIFLNWKLKIQNNKHAKKLFYLFLALSILSLINALYVPMGGMGTIVLGITTLTAVFTRSSSTSILVGNFFDGILHVALIYIILAVFYFREMKKVKKN